MRLLTALTAAALLGGLACGNSREERALDEAQAACLALTQPGTTLDQAAIALRGGFGGLVAECRNLGPLDSNDTCAPASGDTRCAWFWYFPTNTICSATGGCCGVCEVRVLQSDEAAKGGGAAVCGSAFYRRQPCP